MMEFAKFLNDAIREQGWSISEFARQAGLTQSSVSDVLNGKGDPTERFVIKAAAVLGVPYPRLLRMTGHASQLSLTEEEQEEIWLLWTDIDPADRPAAMKMLRGLAQPGPQSRREGTILSAPEGAIVERAQPPPLTQDERFEIFDALVCALCPAGSENREEKMRYIAEVFAFQAELYGQLKAEGKDVTNQLPRIRALFERISERG